MAYPALGLLILLGVFCMAVGILLLIAAILSRTPARESRARDAGDGATQGDSPRPRRFQRAA